MPWISQAILDACSNGGLSIKIDLTAFPAMSLYLAGNPPKEDFDLLMKSIAAGFKALRFDIETAGCNLFVYWAEDGTDGSGE
jgi:hypothetical protein